MTLKIVLSLPVQLGTLAQFLTHLFLLLDT